MSYTNKIIKTYFWQFASNGLRFLSMFIVAPFLTKKPIDYGIYMICMSMMVFFTFADFGFLTAGAKYIAEFVGKKDMEKESDVIGLSLFINLLFMLVFMLVFTVFIVHPEWLIKDLRSPEQFSTARKLLIILVACVPFKMIERTCAMILSARVHLYVQRRLYMVASCVTIAAVYFFFSKGNYNIAGYYAFSVCMEMVALLFTVRAIGKKFGFKFALIVKKVRYNPATFRLMKNLAASSLYTNFILLLFAHIDLLFISKTVGAQAAAIYGIALNLMNYFETFIGSNGLCGPFLARFNHIVGEENNKLLTDYFFRVMTVLLSVVVLPIVCIIGYMNPFIHCWVGKAYGESVPLASILLLSLIFHHVSLPSNYVLTAKNKAGILALSTTLTVIVYWGGNLILLPIVGILALPISKSSAYLIAGFYRIFIASKSLSIKLRHMILRSILPTIILGLVGYYLSKMVAVYLPIEKNKMNLLLVIGVYALTTSVIFIMSSLLQPKVRNEYQNVIRSLLGKKSKAVIA